MGAASSDTLPPHLRADREVHVIVSVLSGQHKAQEYYDETLKPLLDQRGVEYLTHTTTSAQTIINLTQSLFVRNATQGVKQTIILLSGDGGVVDIVNTLSNLLNRQSAVFYKPLLVLVPMGTANALAWSSGVAQDPLHALLDGTPKSLPSFQVRFSPGAKLVVNEGQDREELSESEESEKCMFGAVVFSWGLHASLVAMSDTVEYRKHGLDRFKMAAQRLLSEPHRYRGKVLRRLAGEEDMKDLPDQEHAYVLASLVSNLEEHFRISPASTPVDGSLHLVYIAPELPHDILHILGQAYHDGKHVEDPKLRYESIDTLRVEVDEEDELWRQMCVDGKIVAVEKGGWAEVTRLPTSGADARQVVELVC